MQVKTPCEILHPSPHWKVGLLTSPSQLPKNLRKDRERFHNGDPAGFDLRPVQPALTRVSKQVRADTLPMFYGAMLVEVNCCQQLYRNQICGWFENIGQENSGMIRSIKLDCRLYYRRHDQTPPTRVESESEERIHCRIALLLEQLGVRKEAIVGWRGESFEEMVAAGRALGL